MKQETFVKIFIISSITPFALVIIAIILYIILSVLIVNGLGRDARKAYEATRTEVVAELDSFINVNDRLPHSLSELGYDQTSVAYDLENRIRVNSNKATPSNYRCDSILYLTYKHLSSQMSMEGWAMSSGGNILLPYEFGEWVYRDAEGNTYRKFWNYREGDSLIFKPDLSSKLIHIKKN